MGVIMPIRIRRHDKTSQEPQKLLLKGVTSPVIAAATACYAGSTPRGQFHRLPFGPSLRFGDARTVPMAPLTFKLRCSGNTNRYERFKGAK